MTPREGLRAELHNLFAQALTVETMASGLMVAAERAATKLSVGASAGDIIVQGPGDVAAVCARLIGTLRTVEVLSNMAYDEERGGPFPPPEPDWMKEPPVKIT